MRREVVLLCVRVRVEHGGWCDSCVVYVLLGLGGVVGNGMEATGVLGIAGHLIIHVWGLPMLLWRHLHGHLLKLVRGDEGFVGSWIAGVVEAVWSYTVELQADACRAWP